MLLYVGQGLTKAHPDRKSIQNHERRNHLAHNDHLQLINSPNICQTLLGKTPKCHLLIVKL